MTRRSAFEGWNAEAMGLREEEDAPSPPASPVPPSPIMQLQVARPRKRKRAWEREHRGRTFYVPTPLVDRAKAVRQAVLGLAQKHMTTADQVADALLSWAIAQVAAQEIALEARPTLRRKMSVRVVDANGWPEEIEEPKAKRKQSSYVRVTYRLSGETIARIISLSSSAIAPGEVIVVLLEHALSALQSGRVRLQSEPEVVRQKVTAWEFRENSSERRAM